MQLNCLTNTVFKLLEYTVEFAYIDFGHSDSSSISTLFCWFRRNSYFFVHSSSPILTSVILSVRLYRNSFLSPRACCSFIVTVVSLLFTAERNPT